jgi:hypothetical protein
MAAVTPGEASVRQVTAVTKGEDRIVEDRRPYVVGGALGNHSVELAAVTPLASEAADYTSRSCMHEEGTRMLMAGLTLKSAQNE